MKTQAIEAHAARFCSLQAQQIAGTCHARPPAALWRRSPVRPVCQSAAFLRDPVYYLPKVEYLCGQTPLFSPDSRMYARFRRFVSCFSAKLRETTPQRTKRKQGREVSCSAVAVASPLDEIRRQSAGRESPNGMPLPDPIHAELAAEEVAGRRIILVGDVHGKLSLLGKSCSSTPPVTIHMLTD
jgi:hypothetical protein